MRLSVGIDPKGRVLKGRGIRVGQQDRFVVLFVDNKPVPMTTSEAVTLYLELSKKAEDITRLQDAGEIPYDRGIVILKIERERIPMWPEFTRKLAGALMRKTDQVDDWQIENPLRVMN